MNKKDIIISTAVGILAALLVVWVVSAFLPSTPLIKTGSIGTQSTYGGTGTTNATSSVNTTSTQVIAAGWTQEAIISNNGTSTLWCALDNLTAASSSATSGLGVLIGPLGTTTQQTVCFGPASNCHPYVGAINCVANTNPDKVGITYH